MAKIRVIPGGDPQREDVVARRQLRGVDGALQTAFQLMKAMWGEIPGAQKTGAETTLGGWTAWQAATAQQRDNALLVVVVLLVFQVAWLRKRLERE